MIHPCLFISKSRILDIFIMANRENYSSIIDLSTSLRYAQDDKVNGEAREGALGYKRKRFCLKFVNELFDLHRDNKKNKY